MVLKSDGSLSKYWLCNIVMQLHKAWIRKIQAGNSLEERERETERDGVKDVTLLGLQRHTTFVFSSRSDTAVTLFIDDAVCKK